MRSCFVEQPYQGERRFAAPPLRYAPERGRHAAEDCAFSARVGIRGRVKRTVATRNSLSRTPPAEVRRILRREVGFGCPVPDCVSPYLEWHHFDPPWHVRKHHDPHGMIALCAKHHPMAERNGPFTIEQLRSFKQDAGENGRVIQERFAWMRNNLMAVIGGNFYYENGVAVQYGETPIIFFRRDDCGNLLVNLRMLTAQFTARARVDDSYWMAHGPLEDLESPPHGRVLKISYPNGDLVRLEFIDCPDFAALKERYDHLISQAFPVPYPITIVEVEMRVGGTDIAFGPRETRVAGISLQGCFLAENGVGLHIGIRPGMRVG